MPKETRRCKQCDAVFKKRYPLDMFCALGCASAYKKERQEIKKSNGPVSSKSTGLRAPERKTVLVGGSPIGEKEVFERIWGTDPAERRSFVTGQLLPDIHRAYPWYFSHILPKGNNRYPMFRFYSKNIVLKTFHEHEQWENHQYKLQNDPKWAHVFELRKELLAEYAQHKEDYEKGKVEYYKI